MRKNILIAMAAIALAAFVSCGEDQKEDNQDSVSIEGRWNAPRHADSPEDYAFSLVIKGNSMDAYIIAWGEHFVGTYTYADGTINYNITKAYKAWDWSGEVDGDGNMINYSWFAGGMDQETFELGGGYAWYEMSAEDLEDRKQMLSQFKFEVKGNTAKCSDLFGIEGMTFYKAK